MISFLVGVRRNSPVADWERMERERSSIRWFEMGSSRARRPRSMSCRAAMCVMNFPAEPRVKVLFSEIGGEDGERD